MSEPSANGSEPEALEAWRPPDRPTPEYAAVQSILAQAVQGLYNGLETLARSHTDAAERIVDRYANPRNRLRYLLGVSLGVVSAAAAGLVVFSGQPPARCGRLAAGRAPSSAASPSDWAMT